MRSSKKVKKNSSSEWELIKTDQIFKDITRRYSVRKKQISYDKEIDINMREIVLTLNKIPWLMTTGCCEGHFKNHKCDGKLICFEGYNAGRGYVSFEVVEDFLIEQELLPFLNKINAPWDTYEMELEKRFTFDSQKRKGKITNKICGGDWFLRWRAISNKEKKVFLKKLLQRIRAFNNNYGYEEEKDEKNNIHKT